VASEGLAQISLAQYRTQGYWKQAWRRLVRKRIGVVCLVIIVIIYLAGALASWVTPYGYNDQNLSEPDREARFCGACEGPSFSHPFGTDVLGRDQFTRVIYSLRTTVIVTIAGILTGSLFLGIGFGLLSGYFRGWVDSVINRVGELFTAFPTILLVILLAASVRPPVVDWVREFGGVGRDIIRLGIVDYFIVFGALSAFSWVGMMRIVRGQVLSVRENQYVDAAVSLGASNWRILRFHVLPNILSPVIVLVSMGMGSIAGSEVFLSFIGIGIQSPTPSLGIMMFEYGSVSVLRTEPYLLLFPAATLALLLFTFNLLGDALNDALNPRAR
jgi:oligopeptide transport system permease protein